MKIDNAQALTAQSTPFVGKEAALLAKAATPSAVSATSGGDATRLGASQPISLTQPPSQALVTEVNDVFKLNNSALQFQLDQDAGKMVLYLKDSQTGETLRQFPDEMTLRISKQINDYLESAKSYQNAKDAVGQLSGLITDTKA
jgi:flagellar protein FlaG